MYTSNTLRTSLGEKRKAFRSRASFHFPRSPKRISCPPSVCNKLAGSASDRRRNCAVRWPVERDCFSDENQFQSCITSLNAIEFYQLSILSVVIRVDCFFISAYDEVAASNSGKFMERFFLFLFVVFFDISLLL